MKSYFSNKTGDDYPIPKLINIVWLGGPLIKHHVARIAKWVALNPSFQLTLWVDDGNFNEVLKQAPKTISMRSISQLTVPTHVSELMHKLSEKNQTDQYVPNYGAASDLIRFYILHEFGGWYVDTDIEPINLMDIKLNRNLKFYCHATREQEKVTSLIPDVIASAPHSAFTQIAIDFVSKLAHILNHENAISMICNNTASIRTYSTFVTTGYTLQVVLNNLIIDGRPILYSSNILGAQLFDSVTRKFISYNEKTYLYNYDTNEAGETITTTRNGVHYDQFLQVRYIGIITQVHSGLKTMIELRNEARELSKIAVLNQLKDDHSHLKAFSIFATVATVGALALTQNKHFKL